MLGKKIALELGESSIRICARGGNRMVVIPACTASDATGRNETLVGNSALERHAEDPTRWPLFWPVRDGEGERPFEPLLKTAINRVIGRQRLFRPEIVISVPTALSNDRRRDLLGCVAMLGSRTTFLVDEPLAVAFSLFKRRRHLMEYVLVTLGEEGADISVVSSQFLLDTERAEAGSVWTPADPEALFAALDTGIAALRERLPFEFWRQLLDPGIVVAGVHSGEEGITERIGTLFGAKVTRIDDPEDQVIGGLCAAIDDWDVLKRAFVYIK